MSIDNLTPLGESGALESETTFEDWVDNGFVDERVRYTRLNRELYRGDSKINEMLDVGPRRAMPGATHTQVLTGLWPAGTSGLDSVSSVDTSKSTADYYDLAYARISGVKKIIGVDEDTALNVDIIDVESMTFDGSQALSASSLPATYTWVPVGITCDLDSAYILFVDSGAYVEWRIQAYDLSTWSVKSGWPATGTDPYTGDGSFYAPSVIHATNGLLAIANPALGAVSASTDSAVVFIDKTDGTIDSSGAGDQTSGSAPSRICSNGTYVFTAQGFSIDISTPSSGCGGTNWPSSFSDSVDVACVGDLVFFSVDGTSFRIGYVSTITNAGVSVVSTSDTSVCESLGRLTTDGLYFWATGIKTVGATNRCCMYKIDPHRLIGENSSTFEAGGEEIVTPVGIDAATVHPTSLTEESPPIVYDGESMWAVLDESNDDVFHRISRANLR